MNSNSQTSNSNSFKHDKKSAYYLRLNEERMTFAMSCLIDKEVVVNLENGEQLKGLFNSFDPASRGGNKAVDIALNSYLPSNGDNENNANKPVIVYGNEYHYFSSHGFNKNMLKSRDTKATTLKKTTPGKFKTDTEISASKQTKVNPNLTEWKPSESVNESQLVELEKVDGEGWDQFETNNREYGVVSTFDENLYTTSLNLNEIPDSVKERAEMLAAEIENSGETNYAQVESLLEDEDVANSESTSTTKASKDSKKKEKSAHVSKYKGKSSAQDSTDKSLDATHSHVSEKTEKSDHSRPSSPKHKHERHTPLQIGVNALNIELTNTKLESYNMVLAEKKQKHVTESKADSTSSPSKFDEKLNQPNVQVPTFKHFQKPLPEHPKLEQPKIEPPKAEQPKPDPTRLEQLKAEQAKQEVTKSETGKGDAIRSEKQKPEDTKQERGERLEKPERSEKTEKADHTKEKPTSPKQRSEQSKQDHTKPSSPKLQQRSEHSKVEKPERSERPSKDDSKEKPTSPKLQQKAEPKDEHRRDRTERLEKSEKPERSDKLERQDRVERSEKQERPEKTEKPEKTDHTKEKPTSPKLHQKQEQSKPDHTKAEQPKVEHTKSEPPKVEHKQERLEKPDHTKEKPTSPKLQPKLEHPKVEQLKVEKQKPEDTKQDKPEYTTKVEKPERQERSEKLEKLERQERLEKTEKPDTKVEQPKVEQPKVEQPKKSFKFNPNASSFTPTFTTEKPAQPTREQEHFVTPTISPKTFVPKKPEFKAFKVMTRFPRLDLRRLKTVGNDKFTERLYDDRWPSNSGMSYRDVLGDLTPLHAHPAMAMRAPQMMMQPGQMPHVMVPQAPHLTYPTYQLNSYPLGMLQYGPQVHPRFYNGVQYTQMVPAQVMGRRNHMPASAAQMGPLNHMPNAQYVKSRSNDFDDKSKGHAHHPKQNNKK